MRNSLSSATRGEDSLRKVLAVAVLVFAAACAKGEQAAEGTGEMMEQKVEAVADTMAAAAGQMMDSAAAAAGQMGDSAAAKVGAAADSATK